MPVYLHILLYIQGSDFKAKIRMKQLAQTNCALPIYLRLLPVYVDNLGHLLKHVTSRKVWG